MSAKVTAAAGVLELPAGTITITHTEIGDKIETEAVVARETTPGVAGMSRILIVEDEQKPPNPRLPSPLVAGKHRTTFRYNVITPFINWFVRE